MVYVNNMTQPLLNSIDLNMTRNTLNSLDNHDSRTVFLFEGENLNNSKKYPKNIVITSRYTLLTFIPKALLEQFRRLANIYFVVIGSIAAVGAYTSIYETSISPIGLLLPMILVISISMCKEGVEDVKRHQTDAKVNSKLVKIVEYDGSIKIIQRNALKVGSLVLFKRDDEIPADIIVLKCGGIQGSLCYVATVAIDGETSLKTRQPALKDCSLSKDVLTINGERNYVYGVELLRSVHGFIFVSIVTLFYPSVVNN